MFHHHTPLPRRILILSYHSIPRCKTVRNFTFVRFVPQKKTRGRTCRAQEQEIVEKFVVVMPGLDFVVVGDVVVHTPENR